MNTQSYLMFKLNHSRYGIPVTAVQELFFLPEITAIAKTPPGVLGAINLRGELLSVIDLHQQLGEPRSPFQLTDSTIVLEWQTQRVGIIVNQVDEVQAIALAQITTNLYGESQAGLTVGIATVENEIVTLLNPEILVQHRTESVNDALKHTNDSGFAQGLYNHFDAQARQVLRERTFGLQDAIAEQESVGLMPLAVVGLGGEYFGFELETVHEFTEIHKITPIPCCPPHIVGNINLRGEIVTLIDISDVVDLSMNAVRSQLQAVIVRLEQRVAGIAVDDIFDVVYIHPSQMATIPVAMHSAKDDYLQGVAPYQDRMMSIINLSKLLTSDVLVVNQEV
ncbi:MAG: chemotaxis protein CheW [Aulosira sp. ZfuVER01]|nr:chemotaxis protein CheW [Aulosira sp. ZfuVER01]MDZ8000271.1 chemotaxis protein CheW [Aulosira sp. DedVER01a]MDZ8053361.1 chemotaxis protein CheW [Aulosira sp. ZfuCHP01]